MTKKELVEMLEDVPDSAEVEVALQPHYPMMGRIRNVCLKLDAKQNPVGAVIACSDHESYTSSVWWSEYDVTVDEDGEPIDDDDGEEVKEVK